MFGSLGWGIMAVIAGAVIDKASSGMLEKNYTPAFFLCLLIFITDLVTATRLEVKIKHGALNYLRSLEKCVIPSLQ